MDLQRVAVKVFAPEGGAIPLPEFIPVFHSWIQGRRVGGTLIDVADYGHLSNGPGVVLIGHDADYFMDTSEGPFGLIYNRKRGLEGSAADRWRSCFGAALKACAELEKDFKGKLKFRAADSLVIFNDRLETPNEESTFSAVRADLESTAAEIYGGKVELTRREDDPRSRLAVEVRASENVALSDLVSRLK